MSNRLKTLAALLGFCASSLVMADSTLVFENIDADGNKSQQTVAISGRWMRSETDRPGKPDYSLMDSGRLMQFNVNEEAKSYRVVRLGRLFWPDAPPAPVLKPAKKRQSVAGVPCIVVQEMGKDGPVAEHCMAGIGPLGLSRRELIVMSRLFMTGRKMRTWEVGVATPDERQISISSRSLTGKQSRVLKSVTHQPVENVRLKVPDDYTRILPDVPRNPITDPEEFKSVLEKQAADKAEAAEKAAAPESIQK